MLLARKPEHPDSESGCYQYSDDLHATSLGGPDESAAPCRTIRGVPRQQPPQEVFICPRADSTIALGIVEYLREHVSYRVRADEDGWFEVRISAGSPQQAAVKLRAMIDRACDHKFRLPGEDAERHFEFRIPLP